MAKADFTQPQIKKQKLGPGIQESKDCFGEEPEKKINNAPRIRFPGFTDDWEQRKFGELYKKSSEKNDGSIGMDKNITVATMQYKEDVKVSTDEYLKTYYTFKLGDIAFEGHQSKDFRFGRFVENDIGDGIVSHIFAVFRPIVDYDLLFWKYAINNERLMQKVLSRSTKASTMMHDLVTDDFLAEKFLVPTLEEQRMIGSFLASIDKAITLHQRKLDAIKTLKTGLLQKMFPKEGERVPEIRLPGFTGDWKQRKLGDTVSLRGRIGFRGYTQADLVEKGNGAITFSPSDIDDAGNVSQTNNKYVSWAKYEESPEIKVQPGDILFTKTASIGKIGYVRELKEKATINPQFALLTPLDGTDGYFTFLAVRTEGFMKQVRDITGGSSVPTMSQEKLKELTFMVPSLNEQNKLGEFFENIDKAITLHQRKLDQMKLYKQGLLQQMFV